MDIVAKGFSVRIFMPSGDPEGLRIIEKSNWTGRCVFFPRTNSEEAQNRQELCRTGVYILWDHDEYGNSPSVYIGESDQIANRLKTHESQKDFWTRAFACVSKDQNLNKAHVQYLEARLVELARGAKRCQLENRNTPQMPQLSEADAADAELYLSDLLLCLPLVGINVFEKPPEETPEGLLLYINFQDLTATGYEKSGEFVVLEGSLVNLNEVPSIPGSYKALRSQLVQQGVLEKTTDSHHFRVTQNYPFSSPSRAAAVVLGRSANGRTEWKDINGRTLKMIQESGPITDVSGIP